MKKLFLILMPIVFLFCLNIEIQTASAVTCGSCEKCTSQSCNQWGETCTPHSRWVCDEEGCTGYGDIAYNCRNECVSGMTYGCVGSMNWVCTNWNSGQCYAWNYLGNCSLYGGGYCEDGHYACSAYGYYCPGNMYSYICDYKYGCTSWGCISGHTETWTECAPNGVCVGGWYCNSCASYCSGSDSSCGCKSCTNCSTQNHCEGKTYHDYSCSGNSCVAAPPQENSPKCGGCATVADCTDYSIGQCASLYGGQEGIIGDKRCFEGECQYQHSATCIIECCSDNSNRCCTNCEDKCINVEGRPRSYCSGSNTNEVLDLSNCAGGCKYNPMTCGCGCDSNTNPSTCLSSNDIVWGCKDIGEPDEYCDGDVWRFGGYHCKTTANNFNISDDFFAKIRKIFSSEAKADAACHYHDFLHCKNGCGIQDGKEQCLNNGVCPAGCFPNNCSAPECAGCALCVIDCPDRCSGSIYETGGFVANDENAAATCFYANQEWCGDGCCVGPPPPPPSCSWELKECGYGGCPPATHKGKLCVGIGGCVGGCTLGDIECVSDASCGGVGPVNNPPVAKIDCLDDPSNPPSCNIYTSENITLKGGNSFDSDGSITNYFFNIPSLGRSQSSGNPNFFLGNPAVGDDHLVTLTVRDNDGATGSTTKNFTVVQALAADFVTESGEWEFLRGDTIHFLDKSIPQDRVATRNWTFIDVKGAELIDFSTEKDPYVQFNKPGEKKVTLEVCDGLGDCDDITKSVNIKIPMPNWRETHPKTENIFDNPFLIFASLLEYLEG